MGGVNRLLTSIILGTLAPVMAGCSIGDGSPAARSPEPSATPDGSGGAYPSSITELALTTAAVPPGRYARGSFDPPITLTLGEGWRAVQLYSGFFDVQQQVGSPHVVAVQFANVRGIHGVDGPIRTTDPAEAVATLDTHPNLTVVESSESRIGGLAGAQVTVENAGDTHAEVIDVPPGPLGIDPGRRLWIAFFETDGELLAIMVGGSTERWDEALAIAEPVLESIEIGP